MNRLLLLCGCLAALCLAPALSAQTAAVPPAPRADTLRAGPPPGAPVVLGSDTLWVVRARVGSFTPEARARAVVARLDSLTRDPYTRFDAVRLESGEGVTDVLVGDAVLATVTEADARAAGMSREALARAYAQAVTEGLREQGFWARARIIALGVLFALLATLSTVLVFRAMNRIFPRLLAAIEGGRDAWIPALRVQRLELVGSSQLTDALLWLARMLRFGLTALLLYIAVPIILSFFPWTRRYADQLFDYILTPFARVWRGFLGALPDLFAIGAIIVVTWYLLKLIRVFFVGLARGTISLANFYPDWAIPTYKITRAVVIAFAVAAIFPLIPGSDSASFQGISVMLGLLISFGSAGAIGNMVSGVVLTYMRPFRLGDRVRIADTMGDVTEKSLLVTRIRTTKNVDVAIPNSMVLGSHIINYSSSAKQHGLILHSTVTIGYDVPWRQVQELLVGAARAVPEILQDPAPFVLQTSLDDFYVSYELNAFTSLPNRMAVTYSALHAEIQDRFNQASVEIMSPHYRAARDGNQSTIPAEQLPADYVAPAFRVQREQ